MVETDAPSRSDDVIVDVISSGICGSDLHLLETGLVEGRVMGHEFAGTTPDGRFVAIEPLRSCGQCAACDHGERNLCLNGYESFGIAIDGGFAEQVSVPADALVALPSGVAVSDACLVEPLAVAVHAVRRSRITASDRVAIIGAGPIGLATVAILNAAGITADIAARYPPQQVAAERLGAVPVDSTDGGAYDVVFDAVGTTNSLTQSVTAVRPQGTVTMVGTFWEPVSMDVSMCLKEVDLVMSMMYGRTATGRDVDAAGAALAAHPEVAEVMITHRFPLDGAEEAFAVAADKSAGAIKVVLEP